MKIKKDIYTGEVKLNKFTEVETDYSARFKSMIIICLCIIAVLYVFIHGSMITSADLKADFTNKLASPSPVHIFGTDDVGRDMYLRTIKGLSNSILVGFAASAASLVIVLILSILLVVFGEKVDTFINWLIDVFLSVPHMVFLIIIAVMVGRGAKGIVIGLALTHWTSLTRVIRGEIIELKKENFISVSTQLGKSKFYIAIHHIIPAILPQIIIGVILLFPHAILHEAGISFLGFGFDLQTPSIGVILSDSMKYIVQGYWHLAFFPGVLLVLFVLAINALGENLKRIYDPSSYHR